MILCKIKPKDIKKLSCGERSLCLKHHPGHLAMTDSQHVKMNTAAVLAFDLSLGHGSGESVVWCCLEDNGTHTHTRPQASSQNNNCPEVWKE